VANTILRLPDTSYLGKVWALIKPYWALSEEKWVARGLLTAVVALNLSIVYITVLINQWNNSFFNALQNKDAQAFGHQLLIFTVLVLAYIAAAVIQIKLNWVLQIRWRRWLTAIYFREWLSERVYYKLELKNYGTDNPDQRMQEDLRSFTTNTLVLALDLMRSVVSFFSFILILWGLSGPLHFMLFGRHVAMPGYMVWVALVYAVGGSWMAHRMGRPLIGLNFFQQRFEADLRFALVRMRENAEGIALYRGENDEYRNLMEKFKQVWNNWYGLLKYQKRLIGFTAFYSQLAVIFPFVVAAPRYFAGGIQLGGLMQIADSFGRVQDAMSWFINSYSSLAEWKATVDRLTSFHQAIVNASEFEALGKRIAVTTADTNCIALRDLTVALPDRRVLLRAANLVFAPGQHTIITGPSGSGKSTLFRTLAGIWPFGQGTVDWPGNDTALFLPQRPYLPIGTLRETVSYPAGPGHFSDEQIIRALRFCRLEASTEGLDEHRHWTQNLSPGEQQRLALARALLNKPRWLFLDEATAALDGKTEAYLYGVLRNHLPDTTLISIAHRSEVVAFHQRWIDVESKASGGVLRTEVIQAEPAAPPEASSIISPPLAEGLACLAHQQLNIDG
jgi:putative ATP-binding cassette transporter